MVSVCLWSAEDEGNSQNLGWEVGTPHGCKKSGWCAKADGPAATLSIFSLGSFHVPSFTHSLTPACHNVDV
jgi:hypothetical protein